MGNQLRSVTFVYYPRSESGNFTMVGEELSDRLSCSFTNEDLQKCYMSFYKIIEFLVGWEGERLPEMVNIVLNYISEEQVSVFCNINGSLETLETINLLKGGFDFQTHLPLVAFKLWQ